MSANITPLRQRTSGRTSPQWLVVNPVYQELFSLHQLQSAADVLALPGVVVNGHVTRNVSRVEIGTFTAFLKREHSVSFRTRWKNFVAGFGFVSMSERETAVLHHLRDHQLAGPEWIAHGSANGEYFVLVRGVTPSTKLVDPLLVAREVAAIHQSGLDQPDLYFKHILQDLSGQLTILDWQQARIRRPSVANRVRSLAALHVTTPPEFTRRQRLRFLREYLHSFPQTDRKQFTRDIITQATELAKRKNIRRQLAPKQDTPQWLVRIEGETVCAIPEVADDLRHPEMIRLLHDHTRTHVPVMLPAGSYWRANRYQSLRLWFQGKRWRSPELKTARLLMHLERHGIAAPKMIAYGQRCERSTATAFVAYAPAAPIKLTLPELFQKLHRLGVVIAEPGPTKQPFRHVDGQWTIHDPTCFQLVHRVTWKHVERANRWLRLCQTELG